jgi:vacuolar-type H+-ATPase subunit D/Vma8
MVQKFIRSSEKPLAHVLCYSFMAFVYLNPLKQQLENAQQQRSLLEAQRQQLYQNILAIDQQIAQWDAYIAATAPLAANQPQQFMPGQVSLADLCRMALDAHQGEFITAQQVRSYIEQLGFQLEYNNIMAVIHNTLARVGRKERNAFGAIYASK